LWPTGSAPSIEDSLVGLRSSPFLVRAAPRSSGIEEFSAEHSRVLESSGLYQAEPMRRRVPFKGSEQTQFSPNSLQRRSAANSCEGNISTATSAIRHMLVTLTESITVPPLERRYAANCHAAIELFWRQDDTAGVACFPSAGTAPNTRRAGIRQVTIPDLVTDDGAQHVELDAFDFAHDH
jgi:hypothetical protein